MHTFMSTEAEPTTQPLHFSPVLLTQQHHEDISKSMECETRSVDSTLPDRDAWTGKLDFLVSMLAFCIGLGNVWRFPYLCFKNGGGAFLIPYSICWCVAAVPTFVLEVSIGQYLQTGGISVWKICPLFTGVGLASLVISMYSNIYYCVIVVWAFYYLFASFASTLPWSHCRNSWNNERCLEASLIANNATNASIFSFENQTTTALNISKIETETPVEQFWRLRVLQTTSDIADTGNVVWELALLLLLTWIVSYFYLWKGLTKARTLVYICAVLPYILLFILLIRSVTLRGAFDGIKYYLKPNTTKLLETTVWKDAGTQVFYSYGIGFGVLTALGSYNRYNHNCLRDALILCTCNAITSFLAGFVVFSVLGYMANQTGKQVKDVVKSGVGLVFLAYPEVVSTLYAPQLWSILFFLMVIILGLDSQICVIEGVVTAMRDAFPQFRRIRKEVFVLAVCVFCFILGLPMVTQAGQYWLLLLDTFGASGFALLSIVFFETVGLSWGFGGERLHQSLSDMLGYTPSRMWLYGWKVTAPLACFVIFLFVSSKYEPMKYGDGRSFPIWAESLGFCITCSSIIMIPAYAIYSIAKQPGSISLKQKFRNTLLPQDHFLAIKDKFEDDTTF